jgi:hypothetical protein
MSAERLIEDEIRTRDIQLGKLTLYQLSYTRSFATRNGRWSRTSTATNCGRASASCLPNHTFLWLSVQP